MEKPLICTDSIQYTQYRATQELRLKAGVHRKTWVSGTPLYVDIVITNGTTKPVRRVELRLQKAVTFYGHSAAEVDAEIQEHLRMPDKTQKQVVAKHDRKANTRWARHGWSGTPPQSQEESTCMLEVPTGLATIDTGMFKLCIDPSIS